MTINLDVAEALPARDETSNLTIYRVVQEGMTNAFKHAGASVLDILVEPADMREAPVALREQSRPVVRVAVSDDGKGLSDEMKPSYGVAGMSERVWAMGGEIKLTNRAGGGVTLEAWIPVPAGAKAVSESLPRPGCQPESSRK